MTKPNKTELCPVKTPFVIALSELLLEHRDALARTGRTTFKKNIVEMADHIVFSPDEFRQGLEEVKEEAVSQGLVSAE